jgi:hypothetical protein
MSVKKWLFSNMFFRNMIADLFGRSAVTKPGEFTPYFQYKVAPYQSDYYLYFPKEPYTIQYKNETFNKLNEYSDADITDYLEFHYSAYHDKQAFLKFLRYEIYGRLNRKLNATRHQKLQVAQEWVLEKQRELQSQQQEAIKQEIEKEVREVFRAETPVNQASIENIAQTLSEKLTERLDQIMASTEEKMQTLTSSYIIGKIELNNQNHEEKLMKLFKLLQAVQAPPQIARAEQLFKRFSDTDVAAILWLHFLAFNDKKIETIPRNIRKADELIPDKNPKVKQLADALRDFFYS